jgi:hypothetical protein
MKQLGNLAIVCAKRNDILLQISKGIVTIHVGSGPDRTRLTSRWNDDEKINGFIIELNQGRYTEENLKKGVKAA